MGSAWLFLQVLPPLNLPSHILQCTLTPGQEKHKPHISCCCLLGDIHQWPQSTCSSPSCSPSKAARGLHRHLEEPHQLNALGWPHRPRCLLLRKLKSSVNHAVKPQGFTMDTQHIHGWERAMGKVHSSMHCCALGHILKRLHRAGHTTSISFPCAFPVTSPNPIAFVLSPSGLS